MGNLISSPHCKCNVKQKNQQKCVFPWLILPTNLLADNEKWASALMQCTGALRQNYFNISILSGALKELQY
jgi:hypothetical protein